MVDGRFGRRDPWRVGCAAVSAVFVGRDEESRQLDGALDSAGRGRPAVVLVGGEAGVGKSRLIAEAAARHRRGGGRVLSGGAIGFVQGGLPFAPLVSALRSFLRHGEGDRGEFMAAPEVAALVPEVAGGLVGAAVSEPVAGWRLLRALAELVEGFAEVGPLLVVVEDLHWADRSTCEFLAYLIAGLDRQRLTIVVSYRDDEVVTNTLLRDWLVEQRRDPRVVEIALGPLSRDEVGRQLAGIGGRPESAQVVGALLSARAGTRFSPRCCMPRSLGVRVSGFRLRCVNCY